MENSSSPAKSVELGGGGFLDILLTASENIKLLTIGPLLAGVCAIGVGFLLPKTFASEAILQVDQTVASLMQTTPVLDAVVAKIGLKEDELASNARINLQQNISTSFGRSDKLLTVVVSAATAQLAKTTAQTLIEETYLASRPKGSIKKRLDVQLNEARTRLINAQESAASVRKRMEEPGDGVLAERRMDRGVGYADLLNVIAAAQTQVVGLEALLEAANDALLVQPPTLPVRAVYPRKARLAITTVIFAEIILLVFVYSRQALRNAAVDPTAAEKLARIRASLGSKRDLTAN